jgi:hypothetical protein
MSRVDATFYDQQVNSQWPKGHHPMDAHEASRAAKLLYWLVLERECKLPVALTSGNRYTAIRGGCLYVNPTRGWRDFVHELSHDLFRRTPEGRPLGVAGHDSRHAYLERRMIQHVVSRGWLEGKLRKKVRPAVAKPVPTKLDTLRAKLAAVQAREKAWQTKAKRAATALKKLARSRRVYERLVREAAATDCANTVGTGPAAV